MVSDQMRKRPNVLLVLTDQQSWNAMSCAGNPWISTPAMDRLAEEGVRFTNAYCVSPSCAPSRKSMLTGHLPHNVEMNGRYVAHPEINAGRLFSAAGYQCRYAGVRGHSLPDPPEESGFVSIAERGESDEQVAAASRRFIREHGEGDRNNPFFLVTAFINPHNICQWARAQDTYLGAIEERPLSECPELPANYPVAAFAPQAIEPYMPGRSALFSKDGESDDPNWWRRYRSAYFRLIEMVDALVGSVLDALRDSGQYEDTLVVFAADHGDGQGAHQWRWKNVLYEEAVHIPLIVKPPGTPRAGVIDERVSTGLDLLPTLRDYTGIAPPGSLPGLSWREMIEGVPDASLPFAERDLVVQVDRLSKVHYNLPVGRHGGAYLLGRAIYHGSLKYGVYDWGRYREQLFDLSTDPGEMQNLAVSSAYESELRQMRTLLREWCERTGDEFASAVPGPSHSLPS